MPNETRPLLAAVNYPLGFDINGLLAAVVAELEGRGLTIGGLRQEVEPDDGGPRRLAVIDIRSGKSAIITQYRGKEAQGCKLDPRGLADIAPSIADAIAAGVDLIVINKFGRAESEGGGLLSSIAAAVDAGIPVLTAVREPYVAAWREFHGGLGIELAPEPEAVLAWCGTVAGRRPVPA